MGRDKATLLLQGETLLVRTVRTLDRVANEVLVVGGDPGRDMAGGRSVPDRYPGTGPLGGLLTGLLAAHNDIVLAVACDLPFLQPALLTLLLDLIADHQAVVPRVDGRLHPLLACYTKSAIPVLEEQLSTGRLRLLDLLERLEVRIVDEMQVRSIDPEGRSFLNVNTPEAWQKVQQLAASRCTCSGTPRGRLRL